MGSDAGSSSLERRLQALLGELQTARPPAGTDLVRPVVRRARRQRAALELLQLVVVVARTIPDAVALVAGRRR